MTHEEILKRVDHTELRAFATWTDITTLCDDAVKYKTATVCIPPAYIKRVKEKYAENLKICTVVGFPLGYQKTSAKVMEVEEALKDGADEIDMVINISDAKNGDFDKIEEEIKALKKACGNRVLKVIIETCYLTDEEKISLCKAVTNAGADYIKTSTGFGTAGATLSDIKLFKENIGEGVKMKAAGGIRSVEDMEAFIALGCDRLGTSSAIKILKGQETNSY